MMRAVLAVVAVAFVSRADAEPSLSLAQVHEPPPRHLRMRPPRAAAAEPKPPAAPPGKPAIVAPQAAADDYDAAPIRDVREPVSVRMNLGYAVDGVSLTQQPTLGGRLPTALPPQNDFTLIRAYGFGDLSVSTRGVGLESLSAYFAGAFQTTERNVASDPNNPLARDGVVPIVPPIATWFDRSGVTPRAAWIEAKNFTPLPELAPLRIRAGELYVYGPWVMHMIGALAGWDSTLLSATIYGGRRVADYAFNVDAPSNRAAIGGITARLDLRGLSKPQPIAITAEGLAYAGAPGETPSQHGELDVDWRPRRDVSFLGQARLLDGALANEHVQFRATYRTVTSVVFDFTHRHGADWRWDPAVIHPSSDDPAAPRSYLELGPVLPELFAALRAGTLLFDNVDLLARVATGGALEVRVRRQLAVGGSVLFRQTGRNDPIAPTSLIIDPGIGVPQRLPDPTALGERSFTEAGTTARVTLGARRFSALVELYGRRILYSYEYCLPGRCGSEDTGIPTSDLRGGARFSVEAWIRDRVRLFASYDVSSKLTFQPEITGYRSLRLVMEGRY
jgi:hypothetical protein